MSFVFEPIKTASLAINGSDDRFSVRRVYCVGRNYAAHAREMGSDPDREPPFFFCKPNDTESIVAVEKDQIIDLPYPSLTENYHYEVELVVAIGRTGKNISIEDAKDYIFGYAVGLDMTRRDLQNEMKKGGRPWEIGKAFDYSAPISPIHTFSEKGELLDANIELKVNGETKQKSNINCLTWDVYETIAKLSEMFELRAGDLIFTGTPEGVGSVVIGDQIHAEVEGLTPMTLNIR